MEDKQSEIFAEIREELQALKSRISMLESRLSSLEGGYPVESIPDTGVVMDMGPIDLDFDIDDMMGAKPEDKGPEDIPPEKEEVPETATEAPALLIEEEDRVFNPVKETINDKEKKRLVRSVADTFSDKLSWKKDYPGTPVKNVISAISLNDRMRIINTLFKEDGAAFQEAISFFNNIRSIEEAESWIAENHPEWRMDGDPVYRLMMAVRRKLQG